MENKIRSSETGSVLRACAILRSFRYEGELLRLRDLVARTELSKTTVHRLLHTLVRGGLIERVGAEHYSCRVRPVDRPRRRIGFAAQTGTSTFSQLVTDSVRRAAAAHDVDLAFVDNRYSPKVAVRNAEYLIRQRVDLVIEFQTYYQVASEIASRFVEAGIPVIAIEIPHPGAVFYGADNYQAGLIGGRALGRWAKVAWAGEVDEILLLEERIAGPLPCSRVTGMLAGVREVLPAAEEAIITTYDGRGQFGASQTVVRQHLRRTPQRRTLVAANNDPSALGALRAFEECGREEHCAVMGQNAIPEGRQELRRRGTRLIGTVAYFPERYGDELVPLAISILSGKPTPPAVFISHRLVTPANVDQIYPLDETGE